MNFDSPLAFATHLLAIERAIARAEQAGLEKVAKIIERDAKDQIGHYQDAAGPFPAWAELADSTKADREHNGFPPDEPLLRTGELRKSIQHEVSGSEAVVGSMLDIAAYQEFGTERIPPRPFIGPAAFKNKDKIEKILGAALVQGLTGGNQIEGLGYDFSTE